MILDDITSAIRSTTEADRPRAPELLPASLNQLPLSTQTDGSIHDWPAAADAAEFSAAEVLGRLVRGTLSVLLLLGFALWGLRVWVKRNRGVLTAKGPLAVVDSVALSGRCQLKLVEADGQRVLVGIDASGVKCVTVLPRPFDESLFEADTSGGEPQVELQGADPMARRQRLVAGQPA